MRKLTQKEILVIVLFAGLGIVLFYQYKKLMPSSDTPAEAARAAVKQVSPGALPALVPVTLEAEHKVRIRKNSRNLFNSAKSPSEVYEEERQRREAERLAKEAAERRRLQMEAEAKAAAARAQAEAINPPPPPAPQIRFTFIGKMGDMTSPIAILADATTGDVYTVREGEVIAEKFKIQKIEFDSVTIGLTDALIQKNPTWAGTTQVVRMGG